MLGVVTATVNKQRAAPCIASWKQHAAASFPLVVVENGQNGDDYLGVVSAFRVGVQQLLREHDCDVVACFHDDLVILDKDWDQIVEGCLAKHPDIGLVSFDGFTAVGDDTLYRGPYNPDQLVRCPVADQGEAQPIVAPADFALIGRRGFWCGFTEAEVRTRASRRHSHPRPWAVIDDLGILDHFYDVALGCLARRGGWQVWCLPVRYRHLTGQTTLHDPGYVAWANEEIQGGDRGFWEAAHRIGYEAYKDVLPLRL